MLWRSLLCVLNIKSLQPGPLYELGQQYDGAVRVVQPMRRGILSLVLFRNTTTL